MQRRPERDPAGALQREAIAQRRVGENAACSCGETRPEALRRKDKSVMCAKCIRKQKGHTEMDLHHPAGKSNHSATLEIPVNDHRAYLSVAQFEWPKETLENPEQSPLHRASACIRGFIDTLHYLLEKLLFWTAEMLEVLDAALVEQFGLKWWLDSPLARFTTEVDFSD